MFGFGKKKKAEEAEKAAIDKAINEEIEETSVEVEELKEEENSAEVIQYDRVNGPHDIEEVSEEDLEDYVNLGALRIKMHEGMNLRIETDYATGSVIAATITQHRGTGDDAAQEPAGAVHTHKAGNALATLAIRGDGG